MSIFRPHFSNISSETAGPIKAKFHMEPPWDWGMKVCSGGSGVTWPRWPPCPYMVKTLLLWNLCSIEDLGPTKFYSNDDLGLTLTFLQQGQICFVMLLYGKIYISSGKMLESHLMEETCNKLPEWQKVYVDIKTFNPRLFFLWKGRCTYLGGVEKTVKSTCKWLIRSICQNICYR